MKQFLLLQFILFLFWGSFSQTSAFNTNPWERTSLDKNIAPSELKVYPNPCKTSNLFIESAKHRIEEIEIMNIAGKQILLKKFHYPENKKQLFLNSIQDGIYLVRIKCSNQQIFVKKLVVSKN